ncbi:MAG: hypothetical protein ABEI13_01010 [Candidatus Paceibacteria bacterium]
MPTQNPTPRDKRVLKAHRKRYVENKDLSTIAEEMGYNYDTIRDYFRDDSTERIKQMYDEDELEFMRLQLFQEIRDAKTNAKSYVSKAVSGDTDESTYLKASKEEEKVLERYIKMLQELSLLPKPKERKEVEETKDVSKVREELAEIYRKKQEKEERVEQSGD